VSLCVFASRWTETIMLLQEEKEKEEEEEARQVE